MRVRCCHRRLLPCVPGRLRRGHRSARRGAGTYPAGQRRLLVRTPLVSGLCPRERLTYMTAPTFSRLRKLAEPGHLPALSPEYIRSRPGLGLGPLDPAPRILLPYGSLRERRSEEHTSELQSLMRISYAVFCLKTKK